MRAEQMKETAVKINGLSLGENQKSKVKSSFSSLTLTLSSPALLHPHQCRV